MALIVRYQPWPIFFNNIHLKFICFKSTPRFNKELKVHFVAYHSPFRLRWCIGPISLQSPSS